MPLATLSDPPGDRARALIDGEPALARMVAIARARVQPRQIWLFGSRARGDASPDSDWDIFLVLRDEAPDLDAATEWQIGRDAGLLADVVSERESDVVAALNTVNTLAYVLGREGIRID